MGELSPEVTERARTLTEKYGRCDSITLTEALLIAVRRLYRTGLALSVIASQCHLSQRERLERSSPQSSIRAAASSFVSRLRTAKYAGMRKKQAKNHATGLAMQAAK